MYMNKGNIDENKCPKLAISCLVYNHEPYLRKCLDGFVMQKTTFPFVAIVHDDCSTDGSASVIREYQEKYPDIIKPIFQPKNTYQRHDGSFGRDLARVLEETGAKYIADCEGDDYWTDPLKLQKQVDFLDAHTDYSCCWHGYNLHFIEENRWEDCDAVQHSHLPIGIEVDCTYENILNRQYGGQPLSLVYRTSCNDFTWRDKYKYFCDTVHNYMLLKNGKGWYMNFIGGVYVVHREGVSGGVLGKKRQKGALLLFEELYRYNSEDKLLRQYFKNALSVYCISNTIVVYYRLFLQCAWRHPKVCLEVLKTLFAQKIKHIKK